MKREPKIAENAQINALNIGNHTILINSMRIVSPSRNQLIIARQQCLSITYFACVPEDAIRSRIMNLCISTILRSSSTLCETL